MEDLKFANYFKEVFLDSDTQVACISGSPSEEPRDWFLTNQMKFDARAKVNKEAGSKRMFSHAIMTPGWPGWLDKVDEEMEKLKPDSWKGYTVGDNTNKNLSKHPYRLDDEKIMYPFYERLVKWSKDMPSMVNVCIHKGLFPPSVEQAVSASGRLQPCRRRRQGGQRLAAAQFHHLSLRLPLGRRRYGGTGVGATEPHRPHRMGQRSRRNSRAVSASRTSTATWARSSPRAPWPIRASAPS